MGSVKGWAMGSLIGTNLGPAMVSFMGVSSWVCNKSLKSPLMVELIAHVMAFQIYIAFYPTNIQYFTKINQIKSKKILFNRFCPKIKM